MYMTEQMYREFIESRFGEEISLQYEPITDGAEQRTGTEVTLRIPRDARNQYRQSQFLSVAELTGGYEWDLESDDGEIRLTIATRRRLPEAFDDATETTRPGTAHDDYVASLEGQFDDIPDLGPAGSED